MESTLIALKLMLDALQVEAKIEGVLQRKLIQKAIYLSQRSGVDLGYRFSWYLMGPYSSVLTKDYYALDEGIGAGQPGVAGSPTLVPSVRRKLEPVQRLMKVPTGVTLSGPDWVELVASLDYLLTVSGYPLEKALVVLRDEKPNLVAFAAQANEALRANLATGKS